MRTGGVDNQGHFLGRISIRRSQVASMEGEVEDLELFQRKISDLFSELLPPQSKKDNHHAPHLPPSLSLSSTAIDSPIGSEHDGESTPFSNNDTFLSIAWIRKLLDVFLYCEAEFKAVLLIGREPSQVAKSPLDRLIPDLLDRVVKALDFCNAINHGIDAIKLMQIQAQIVVSSLQQRPFTDGQIRRARRALAAVLSSLAAAEKENIGKLTERSWSFGRRTSGASSKDRHHTPSFKSLSWTLAKHWSAAKQVQSISSNLYQPRGGESTSLAQIVYIMNVVLVFVMWALVATIPCQDRAGLGTHIPVPKQSNWAHNICGIQEKIAEEWKRKEKKGSYGLMEEVIKVEKLAQYLVDFADNFQYPMEEENEVEFAIHVSELAEICRRMDDGLGSLQLQVRELFHKLAMTRVVILDVLDQAGKQYTPNI